jgi:hypothetical protein
MFKRLWLGGLVAAVLALGLVGTTLAQEPVTPGDGVCGFAGTCAGPGTGGWGQRGGMYVALAEALGMTLDELNVALAEGQTISEIAAARGFEMADLVAALIAPRVEALNEAVADGRLTQEQVDEMIEEMTEHLTERLGTWTPGYGGFGGGFGGGCGMGGGFRGGRGGRWQGSGMPGRSPANSL